GLLGGGGGGTALDRCRRGKARRSTSAGDGSEGRRRDCRLAGRTGEGGTRSPRRGPARPGLQQRRGGSSAETGGTPGGTRRAGAGARPARRVVEGGRAAARAELEGARGAAEARRGSGRAT